MLVTALILALAISALGERAEPRVAVSYRGDAGSRGTLFTEKLPSGPGTLKTVEVNGRNLADDPIEVRHGEVVNGVRVVLTNRPTHLRGTLLDDKQRPAEGTVVVFSDDASRWRDESRTVRATRPDQQGDFSIEGLPAGNYLIAAADYVQDRQWYDPEFLEQRRPRALPLSLAEAESKRIDLKMAK